MLKAKCKKCERKHLEILHKVNASSKETACTKPAVSTAQTLYVDRLAGSSKVLLKMSRIILRSGTKSLNTYALLDDGSEHTILLHEAAHQLSLQGRPEDLALRMVRQDIRVIHGAMVSFSVPATQPDWPFNIHSTFTAEKLGLAQHTYPVEALQRRYQHP
ncbi:hypothetical protein AAFF_G00194060 [Aldrovandia affinis]|uniref:Uncharacterized protein n=1 Tax=Aldrovandia affinis TaxID=143900 RepID=A0AAD7WV91_9TELE|nr:hypothetical protein AAFF_G00194060 [Aldrovandia affinis]